MGLYANQNFSDFTNHIGKIVEESETKEDVAINILKMLQSDYYVLHENDDFNVNFGMNLANMGNIKRLEMLFDKN